MVTFLGFLVFLVVVVPEASGGGTGSDGFVMCPATEKRNEFGTRSQKVLNESGNKTNFFLFWI